MEVPARTDSKAAAIRAKVRHSRGKTVTYDISLFGHGVQERDFVAS